MGSFDLSKISNPLLFFSFEWKDLTITSRVTALLHFIMMLVVLFIGEMLFYIVLGVFNTDHLFGFSLISNPCYGLTAPALLTSAITAHKIQVFTVLVFATVTIYFATNIASFRSAYLILVVILLIQVSTMVLPMYDIIAGLLSTINIPVEFIDELFSLSYAIINGYAIVWLLVIAVVVSVVTMWPTL